MHENTCIPKGDPLDSYGAMHILQGCTFRICMQIRVFPKGYALDLYRNTDILQGDTLTMCMKIRVFPMGSFGFVWKHAYLRGHPQDLHENMENLWKCCSNALIRIEMKSNLPFHHISWDLF